MGKIVILDEFTSNKIAAGEVIERPASVVKELVENSIDAGADSISVEIKNGGISYIRVTDNGTGMEKDDVELAFERHATSKIRKPEDLDSISSLGFRGEALASIAAVSRVELITRARGAGHGMKVSVNGGTLQEIREAGCPEGSSFIIRDLFYNTPARYKFLKKDTTEAGYVSEIITRISLGNPNISFRLISNGSTVLHTPGNNDLLSAIFSIYGRETAKKTSEICYKDEKVSITGYAGAPEIARSNRNHQSVFVNGRYIKSRIITSAIEEAYRTLVMKNKYPFVVLKLEINSLLVDVNVHPAKMEVRFSSEKEIFSSVYHSVANAVLGSTDVRDAQILSKNNTYFGSDTNIRKTEHVQENIDFQHFVKDSEPVIDMPSSEQIIPEDNNLINRDKNYIEGEKAVCETGFEKNEPSINKDLLENARIIGQVFSTYIILQDGDNMVLIDQHAAHERILFEKLKKMYYNNESISQLLMSPVVMELTRHEMDFISDKTELFSKMGFEIESFGNNSIIVRAVPFTDKSLDIKAVFLELVDDMTDSYKEGRQPAIEESLYSIACKSAVKANKKLDEAEIKNVLIELQKMENPFTCPHGRPTAVRLKKHDIEKEFKRV